MNKHEYVPKMPNQSELDLIFDTTYPDVQPYLFKVRPIMKFLKLIFKKKLPSYINLFF